MEDHRNSARSEEEPRRIIRDEIYQSRANGGWKSVWITQVMIFQASSALAVLINADSGILSPLATSASLSINLTFLSGLSESQGPSDLISYPPFVSKNHRKRQPMHQTGSSQQLKSHLQKENQQLIK